jgi:hypothetical protein
VAYLMNASPYRGIAPRTTPALRARRALVARIGHDAAAQQDAERVDYYRALIAQAKAQKTL